MKIYSTVLCLCLISFSAACNSYPIFLKGNHFEYELVIRLDAPEVIRGKVEKREVKVEDFTFNVNKSIDVMLNSKPHLLKYENEEYISKDSLSLREKEDNQISHVVFESNGLKLIDIDGHFQTIEKEIYPDFLEYSYDTLTKA